MTGLLSNFFKQKKLLGILFLSIFTGILAATLWPFDFFLANGVTWIASRNGLHFSKPGGVLISSSALQIPSALVSNSVSIELWLRSDETWSARSILAFYDASSSKGILIRQWNGGLLISRDFLRNPESKIPERIYARRVFERGSPLLLTITSGPAGTTIYLNGEQRQSFPNFKIRAGDLSGQVVIGTSPVGFSPWRGDLYLISLYADALTAEEIRLHYDSLSKSAFAPIPGQASLFAQYFFKESSGRIAHSSVSSAPEIQIPKNFFLPYKPFLQSAVASYETTRAYYHDAFANIVGFIPYGFLLYAYLVNTRSGRFAVLYSFLSGALFSFLIEALQGYLPQRDSGWNDVITNSVGALLGALIARHLHRK